MIRSSFVLLMSLSLSSFAISTNFVDGPLPYSDSGVTYIPYKDIQKQMKELASANPNFVQYVEYGKTVNGIALSMIRLEDKNVKVFGERLAVELSGAIHGNEYLGIEWPLTKYVVENRSKLNGLNSFLSKGGVLYFIPVINPDGYYSRGRSNKNGFDLNRDFDEIPLNRILLTQPESKSLANYLGDDFKANNIKLKTSIDYHCCVPALIYPWAYQNTYPPTGPLKIFHEVADIQKRTLGFKAGNAAATVGYNAIGTTVDYFYAKYGTFALTIEGEYGGEMKRFDQHVLFLDELISKISSASI